ncbi:Endonuclease 8-like 1 [Saguinus oedipus]|uniref:Endonuclease 8-like 1 n=1 Tax=Saguinus oedipus TaxID=9490 RepID=A0ABQ9V1X8_SAGOE|nr:Endonuclease 8-like 1 [Saguinus oedipus]
MQAELSLSHFRRILDPWHPKSPLGTRASSIQDCPSRSKDPSRTRRAKRDLPERTATQQPEATSFQQDPEAPKIPKKGRRKG